MSWAPVTGRSDHAPEDPYRRYLASKDVTGARGSSSGLYQLT